MFRRFIHNPYGRAALLVSILVMAALWLSGSARAQSYALKTLYTFNGTDNEFPSGLTRDSQGNLYGIAYRGGPSGSSNNGLVYKFSSAGVFTTLASFDGLDGDRPTDSPIIDADGNLWGITYQGGVDWHPEINHYGWGTVYKISSTGVFTPGIFEFNGPHGANPVGSLAMDLSGNLIGATYQGGPPWNPGLGSFGTGTLFQFTPGGSYRNPFILDGGNGAFPNSGVAMDSQGNFYGTTFDGGTHGFGTLYKLSSTGVMTTLVNFSGTNGKNPMGAVAIDTQGDLYGTTYLGGVTAINNAVNGYGTIWKWSAASGLKTLVSFNGANGMFPYHGVTIDPQGNLFGSTVYGGSTGNGVVFEYSADGVLSTLVDFDGTNKGSAPYSPLSLDNQGNIYGVTNLGGARGYGTVFVVQPVSTTLTVSSVALNPPSVGGGGTVQGTVTTSGPAPAGGIVVTLGSNSSYATPQGPVTIPAGAVSTTFTVSTQAVPDTTPVAISARLGASTQQATLTVAPPSAVSVAMVYLDWNGVPGGQSTTGTVLLNRVAPAGGTLATLSSASTNVSVPASIMVPAGAISVDFPIATNPVTATDDAMITVSVGSSSMQAGLLVLPPSVATYSLGNLSVNLATVQGETPLLGRILISRPAQAGGITVALSSNSPSVIVPASMTVPEGVGIASFPIQTTAVASTTAATITASLGGNSVQTTVTILAPTTPTISSLSLRPTSVQGGLSSQGTVTLDSVAPAGGAILTLFSTSNAVGMPATVAVPEGETSASFAITTSPVTSTTTAPITASVGSSSRQAVLTLTSGSPGITISSVALSPASVQGGVSTVGVVTLNAPAPFDGAIVTLTSSNTAAATVPNTVIVPAGQTSVLFTAATSVVNASTNSTLTAAYGASTQSALLTVTSAPGVTLSSLSINPATVISGQKATGTVTLSGPAPSGGIVATLLSSDTSTASVPSSVTVPAGATSATFGVSSVPVAANSVATITATAGVISKQATITVTPAAVSLVSISVNPTTISGGGTSQGTVILSNPAPSGGALVTLSSSNTSAAAVPASVTVPAGAVSATFSVTTKTVTASTVVTLTGTYLGISKTASLTVTSGTNPSDTVTISKAEYTVSTKNLHVEAASTSKTAVLRVYVTATGELIGSLVGDGSGRYKGDLSWPSNPQNITVKSSANGTATKAVTPK